MMRILQDVRYFHAIGPVLLGKTNEHIDGQPLLREEFCGVVWAGTLVESIGEPVQRSYDHGDLMAVPFSYEGNDYFFLQRELGNNYEPVMVRETVH